MHALTVMLDIRTKHLTTLFCRLWNDRQRLLCDNPVAISSIPELNHADDKEANESAAVHFQKSDVTPSQSTEATVSFSVRSWPVFENAFWSHAVFHAYLWNFPRHAGFRQSDHPALQGVCLSSMTVKKTCFTTNLDEEAVLIEIVPSESLWGNVVGGERELENW